MRQLCLGVESTAHTLGLGIVDSDGKILADVRRTYRPEAGGIHPREAARMMADSAGGALRACFSDSSISPEDLTLVSFSQGPGLGPCLRTGATLARAIASHLGVPLVGVNHCVAHIEVGEEGPGTRPIPSSSMYQVGARRRSHMPLASIGYSARPRIWLSAISSIHLRGRLDSVFQVALRSSASHHLEGS